MNLAREIAVLARVHWRIFTARTVQSVQRSRLMAGTITLFLAAYLVAGYFLFCRGLNYMVTLPGVGLLLTERIVYMAYFFFFLMLVFSNSILLYSGIFRGKETPWLLTTPLDPRSILCWKVVESFLVSSWGLAVLSAPLLASVGSTFGAGPGFYVRSLAVYPLFLVLPAMVAALLVIGLVRWWGPALRAVLAALGGAALVSLVLSWRRAPDFDHIAATTGIKNAFSSVMGYTEASMNRYLPSAWMAEQMLLWARGFAARGTFFGLLLASWVLLSGWVCLVVASPATYRAWNLSQARRVGRTRRKPSAGSAAAAFAPGWTRWLPFLRRDTAALIRKDLREFRRDPAQWIPSAVVFSMLLVYAANLNRAMDGDPDRPYFRLMLSSLNFAVCGLTLSTLTTRFVFPMFSLEGRRLWILGLSPVGLERVFRLKLFLFGGILAAGTATLMLVSGLRLGMKSGEMLHYCGAIVLMSGGLTSLALSLGVLFPNFHDPSPARIVSGFGGTLCLILNFLYILAFLPLFIWPGFRAVRPSGDAPQEWFLLGSAAALMVLTALTAGIPAFFALKKIKKLEFLGNV